MSNSGDDDPAGERATDDDAGGYEFNPVPSVRDGEAGSDDGIEADSRLVRQYLAQAWAETDLPPTLFAMLLSREADLYAKAPELAVEPHRVRRGLRCDLCSTATRAVTAYCPDYPDEATTHEYDDGDDTAGRYPHGVLVCDDHADALALGAWDGIEYDIRPLR